MTRTNADLGRLLLRITLGGCMLLHGIAKLQGGIDGIVQGVTAIGLPGFVAYGVYVGEIVAPVLLILGWYSRIGAALIAINMVFAIAIAHRADLFKLGEQGGWALELQGMYLIDCDRPRAHGAGPFQHQRPLASRVPAAGTRRPHRRRTRSQPLPTSDC